MLLTLFTYAIFSDLRNLPGVCIMNLTASVFMFQATYIARGYLSSNGEIECLVIAVILHYESLLVFSWYNVMAWDIYKTFGNLLGPKREKSDYLVYYFLYGYLVPFLVVAAALVFHYGEFIGWLQIEYGGDYCWLGNPYAAGIFFGFPLLLICFSNLSLYILTMISIKKDTASSEMKLSEENRSNMLIAVKIATVVGFTWFVGLPGAFIPPSVFKSILLCMFDLLVSLQGSFIFLVFTYNSKVKSLYKDLVNKMKSMRERAKCNICNNCMCECTRMARSLSTQTATTVINDDGV